MHVAMLVAFGLVALAAFVLVAKGLGRRGLPYSAPKLFIVVWLIASLLNEVSAFIPIFGIPAAVAWWVMHSDRAAPGGSADL
jgi:hypothetical protein